MNRLAIREWPRLRDATSSETVNAGGSR